MRHRSRLRTDVVLADRALVFITQLIYQSRVVTSAAQPVATTSSSSDARYLAQPTTHTRHTSVDSSIVILPPNASGLGLFFAVASLSFTPQMLD